MLAIRHVGRFAVDAHEVRGEGGTVRRPQHRLEGPVLAGDERLDLPLAFHHEAHRDGLNAARGQAAADLAREQRAEGVAHEPVHDPACLLRVHEVHVDGPRVRERLADGGLGDLREGHPALLVDGDLGGFRHVPGDRLALTVKVSGQEHGRGATGLLADRGDLLAAVLADHIVGREVVLHVHTQLALAGVIGEVTYMSIRGEDLVVLAEVTLEIFAA